MMRIRWSRATALGILLVGWVILSMNVTDGSTTSKSGGTAPKKKEIKIRSKREGSWSDWSIWSPCSRTCGGGIRTQTRQCQIRKRSFTTHREKGKVKGSVQFDDGWVWKNVSSRHCEGHAMRHHLCNTHECPKGTVEFRDSQCKAFDNRPFMGKVYQWQAFVDDRTPCSLTCRALGFRFFATLNKSVIDGTPCKTKPSQDLHVCVYGVCTSIGCDGIAGSQRRLDRCGVCGGDNSTCRVVSGIFTRPQLPVGYNVVAHIPRGACNLNITQLRKSPNYLALRRKDGSFIINGNWAISWPGDYEAAGATFSYTRHDLKTSESIVALGPLREPVDLMVLYQQPNPGIKYEYMLPIQGDTAVPPVPADQATWTVNSRVQPASAPVTRRPDVRHVVVVPGAVGPTGNPYDPSLASSLYVTGNGSSSSLFLPKPLALTSAPGVIDRRGGSSPVVSYPGITGLGDASLGVLGGGGASKAGPPGGGGGQEQQHPHLHSHHHGRRNHRNRAGNNPNKIEVEKKFYWKITGYTNCSESCGGGSQRSIVRCVRGTNGVLVSDRRCHLEEKPPAQTIRCNLKPCPAEWITGPWSSCSEPCGPNGFQTRTVHCQQRVSTTFTMRVAEGACLEKQPEAKKGCFIKPCHQWTTSAWSQCSTPCGNGIRSRKVNCVDSTGEKIEDKDCDLEEKPVEISACNMGPCEGVDWFTSDWSSDCSETCGNGLQSRHVVCSGLDAFNSGLGKRKISYDDPESNSVDDTMLADAATTGNSLSDYRCDESLRPSGQRECFADRFCGEPSWFTGPWSQCSASCGQGLRSRQVLCVLLSRGKFKVVDHTLCTSSAKPEDTSSCDHPNPCPPRWFASDWSECTASCGGGIQRRSISCRGSNWTMSSSLCIDGNRPIDRRSCNELKCESEVGTTLSHSGRSRESTRDNDTTPSPKKGDGRSSSGSREESSGAGNSAHSNQNQNRSHHSVQNVSYESNVDTEVSDGECTDQYRNCALVVQARLCRYKYYRSVCCSACSDSL